MIPQNPLLPQTNSSDWPERLTWKLTQLFRQYGQQINQVSAGQIAAAYNAQPAPPTTGKFSPGDEIRNTNPTELGSAGSKYIVRGWIYTAAGWKEQRFLTGG